MCTRWPAPGASAVGRSADALSASIATVVQGGNPSVHDQGSFDGANASLDDILALIDRLLTRRSSGTGPSIFICLGHQLAAASHVRLIRRAASEVLALTRLPLDPQGHALSSLQRLCRRIVDVGESLQVIR